MTIGIPEQASQEFNNRLKRLRPWLLFLLFFYIFRLWYLQIYHGNYYKIKSEKYRIRSERVIANRGLILDRFGKVIVENRPSFNLDFVPEACSNVKKMQKKLISILPRGKKDIINELKNVKKLSPVKKHQIFSNLTFKELAQINARNDELPGVFTSFEAKRFYSYNDEAAQILGYMGQITSKEWKKLSKDPQKRFTKRDLVGKSGIEQKFNNYLTGQPKLIYYETDAMGKKINVLTPENKRIPIPGENIQLSIDWRLQEYIENSFRNFTGAIIAMNPNNGDVLAMVSKPAYDPNLFSLGISVVNWKKLSSDPLHPMVNRAIQAAYSPGSIFKIITAATALENKTVNTATKFFCKGSDIFYKERRYCWKRSGHGEMDIHNAIVNSCNIFFFHLGEKLDITKIAAMAKRFGLGKKTNISLPNEEAGLIPNPEWKRRVLHKSWWKGETLSVAIGQGSVLTTPIQMVTMISAVANGGILFKPRLILKIGSNYEIPVKKTGNLNLNEKIMKILRESLRGVVNEKHGTARRLKDNDIIISGKTGTTQVVTKTILAKYGKNIPKKYKDHNWFVGFAPFDKPQLAIVVFIEHGGRKGTIEKLLLAHKIFRYYLLELNNSDKKILSQKEIFTKH